MTETSNTYRGGVLIIGSLLWQEGTTDQPWDGGRKAWRREQLEMKAAVKVYAPIRYGRYSAMKRIPVLAGPAGNTPPRAGTTVVSLPAQALLQQNGTAYVDLEKKSSNPPHTPFTTGLYTMVLSMESQQQKQLGTAFVAPLRRILTSVEQIRQAAVELARAEGICKPGEDRFITSWGMISVQTANEELLEELTAVWRAELKRAKEKEHPVSASYLKLFCMKGEKPCINKDGLAAFDELMRVEQPAVSVYDRWKGEPGFDFVLCAVTMPKHRVAAEDDATNRRWRYPTAAEIGALAQVDLRRYFQQNYKNGIRTPDDEAIWNRIGFRP